MRAFGAVLVLLVVACRPPGTSRDVAPASTPFYTTEPLRPTDASPPATATPASALQPRYQFGPYQIGKASWYGDALRGHKTASGERFDPGQMTAAHRTLPIGTWVLVTRPDVGLEVRVRINDRGPFGPPDWIVDVSKRAADALDMVRAGVVRVELRVVDGP